MEKQTINIENNIAEISFLENVLSHATNKGYSFALWRVPQTSDNQLIIGNSELITTDDLENNDAGFVIHPYSKIEKAYLIKGTFQASFSKKPIIKRDDDDLMSQVDFINNPPAISFYRKNDDEQTYCSDKKTFNNYVVNGIDLIQQGILKKVVPSRNKKIALPKDFDAIQTFIDLCKEYPNAFVSLTSIPEVGTWLGATPELLMSVDDNKHFKTVALAGTQLYDGKSTLSSVAWTQKEIEEQALVSRYIINCFKKIRLREFDEIGPKTVIAGNLIHLKTTFEVDMKATNFPQLGTVMLNLLHPTSAICGMPNKKAEDFILENEGNNRSFFSGYLGPLNINDQTSIFVNLRCMQIFQNHALIYAGAGLTEDSDPEKEWEETELKMNTLLNVLEKQN